MVCRKIHEVIAEKKNNNFSIFLGMEQVLSADLCFEALTVPKDQLYYNNLIDILNSQQYGTDLLK